MKFINYSDKNECDGKPCPATEKCHNTVGSYICTCKPGYERLSSSADCTGRLIYTSWWGTIYVPTCKLGNEPHLHR